jgi:hypothetical protein
MELIAQLLGIVDNARLGRPRHLDRPASRGDGPAPELDRFRRSCV